jgi:hypothetical protein
MSSLEKPGAAEFSVDEILKRNEEASRLRGFFRYDIRMKQGRKLSRSPSGSMRSRNNLFDYREGILPGSTSRRGL